MFKATCVLVAVLTLTGCATGAAQLPASPDEAFLVSVRADAPSLADTDDTVLIESGRGVCSALDDGVDAEQLAVRAHQFGLTLNEGTAIINAAISVYCPTHVWTLDA